MLYLNNKEIKITNFPNGETLINSKDLLITKQNKLLLKFENDGDFINLIFIKEYLDEIKVQVELIIPYMPYSRMDRTENKTIFTLKYICKLINKLNFDQITIYEPHSDVCVALLNRVKVINMSNIIAKQIISRLKFGNEDYIFYPDAGALKRYSKQIKYNNILTGNKERDFETGYIKKLIINGDLPKNPFRVIIVDDLCSKGGTFMLSAQKLKEIGAKEIYLIVAHCENTIFDGDIIKTNLINKIYTTNSILTKKHDKIITLDIINKYEEDL